MNAHARNRPIIAAGGNGGRTRRPARPPLSRMAVRPWRAVAGLFALFVCGCQAELDTTYGSRSLMGAKSINGTAVLSRMFQQAGHKVHSWPVLSPSLHEADVIVWTPDDYELPSQEVQEWLHGWLEQNREEKILIYVGRDFDDAVNYWSLVRRVAPPDQKTTVRRRLIDARQRVATRRSSLPKSAEWPEFFTIDGTTKKQAVRDLSGPWADGIDVAKVEIERHSRIVPADDADVLLAAGDGSPLVSEITFEWEPGGIVWRDERPRSSQAWPNPEELMDGGASRLIVVENGSFLLNRPLANHEHRKLAAKLIERVGPPRKQVVFLQSGPGGPPVRETDPSNQPPSGLAMFTVWPINGVLVHVAALGVVFALSRWPIFGVPRRLERPSLTDFGAHVQALGKLLQKQSDVPHARTLLRNFRQTVLGEGEADAAGAKS